MVRNKSEVIKRWYPVIENTLNSNNKEFNNICCEYMEYLSMEEKCDLRDKLYELNEKIKNSLIFKREIKKEYLNLLTGDKEYLCSCGTIYSPKSSTIFFTSDELIDIFGIEFIRYLDPISFRSNRIDNILEDED